MNGCRLCETRSSSVRNAKGPTELTMRRHRSCHMSFEKKQTIPLQIRDQNMVSYVLTAKTIYYQGDNAAVDLFKQTFIQLHLESKFWNEYPVRKAHCSCQTLRESPPPASDSTPCHITFLHPESLACSLMKQITQQSSTSITPIDIGHDDRMHKIISMKL